MKQDYDAIIVGGGPAGSTAAILLAQAGWSVALIEQQAFPRRKVCGECISATNLSLLDALGVGTSFAALAGPDLRKVGLFSGEETLIADLPPLLTSAHRWGRALGREHLDGLLLERAAAGGADVWQPYRVVRIEQTNEEHKSCYLAGPEGSAARLSAPIMIAANGSWSVDPFDPEQLRSKRRDSDLFAFKGTFRGSPLQTGLLPVLAFPGGYGGIVIGDHDLLTLAFCIRRDVLRACRKHSPGMSAALAAQSYVVGKCAGARAALRGATGVDSWLSVGPLKTGLRHPWRPDGVFAIGNAAGEAHPILGEGISMAIQSAWLLCELLTRCRSELSSGRCAHVGRAYAACWRRNFSTRIRVAAVYSHLAMNGPILASLMPIIRRWPKLLTIGARLGAKARQCVVPESFVEKVSDSWPREFE